MKKKTVRNLVLGIGVALLLIAVLIGVYVMVLLDQVNYTPDSTTLASAAVESLLQNDVETADPSDQVVDPDDIVWTTGPVSGLESHDVITILLIGQDRRPDETVSRSDSMILCVLNKKTGNLTMASIMRDTYVPIPGYIKANRINACYAFGGMALLKEGIRQNFGVVVDGCVEVGFDGFVDLVELAGGVDMELTAEEARHLNENEAYYDYPGEAWHLVAGMNHLTSHQALAYARVRNIGPGDFGRTERQRKVITALLQKAKTMNLAQINDFLMTAAGLVTTDLSRTELLGYAMEAVPLLTELQIESMRIPYENAYRSEYVEGVGYVLIPDLKTNQEVLAKLYE